MQDVHHVVVQQMAQRQHGERREQQRQRGRQRARGRGRAEARTSDAEQRQRARRQKAYFFGARDVLAATRFTPTAV